MLWSAENQSEVRSASALGESSELWGGGRATWIIGSQSMSAHCLQCPLNGSLIMACHQQLRASFTYLPKNALHTSAEDLLQADTLIYSRRTMCGLL